MPWSAIARSFDSHPGELTVKWTQLIGITLLACLAGAGTWAQSGDSTPVTPAASGADLIVFNARIHTGNPAQPAATALAVKQGRIYSVGSDSDILALKSAITRVIDSRGRRLIPGLIDAHTHVLNEGGYNYTLRWDGVPTLRRALAMVSEQARRVPEGHWVKVTGGWSPYQFEEKRFPTLDEVQRAAPDRPLIIQYAYNRAYLNTKAMQALGIGTPRFPLLPETVLEKDDQGRYTGLIHGNTFQFIAIEAMVPQLSFEEEVSSLIQTVHTLNRVGITGIVDAGTGFRGYPKALPTVQAVMRDNRLNLRMPFVDIQFGEGPSFNMVDAQLTAITRTAPIAPGHNLHPQLAHGHVYQGAGELLSAEVHDHENFDRPAVIIPPAKMKELVDRDISKLIQRRIPFRLHISYDENITPFLDALEALNARMPIDGLRWSLEHAETISPENIARVKALGGGIALDTKMALHADGFIATHGLEKALQTPRLRQLVDSGIPLAMTTDAFRAASFNPWVGLSWMVTGRSIAGTEVLAKDNRLTRAEALALFTRKAAWFMQAESELGMIAPGQLADFALLDQDYFEVAESRIKTISSVLTVMDGRVVYGAQDYQSLSPVLPAILPTWSPIRHFGGYADAR